MYTNDYPRLSTRKVSKPQTYQKKKEKHFIFIKVEIKNVYQWVYPRVATVTISKTQTISNNKKQKLFFFIVFFLIQNLLSFDGNCGRIFVQSQENFSILVWLISGRTLLWKKFPLSNSSCWDTPLCTNPTFQTEKPLSGRV